MVNMSTSSAVKAAQARHHGYALLGRVYLEGVSAETFSLLSTIPGLPTPPPVNDESAATYHRLFRFNLFPLESVFLEANGQPGGAVTHKLAHFYAACNFPTHNDRADLLGHELALLAFLTAAEADAIEDGEVRMSELIAGMQQKFIEQHLMQWLPPFVVAMQRLGGEFYSAIAQLTWLMVANHKQAPFQATQLDAAPAFLEEDGTGLKEIADFLATPIKCGVWLGRDEISKLARSHDLPHGFGSRRQMLTNLLRAASQFDTFDSFLASLQQLINDRFTDYTHLEKITPQQAAAIAPWKQRAFNTYNLIAGMRQQLDQYKFTTA